MNWFSNLIFIIIIFCFIFSKIGFHIWAFVLLQLLLLVRWWRRIFHIFWTKPVGKLGKRKTNIKLMFFDTHRQTHTKKTHWSEWTKKCENDKNEITNIDCIVQKKKNNFCYLTKTPFQFILFSFVFTSESSPFLLLFICPHSQERRKKWTRENLIIKELRKI